MAQTTVRFPQNEDWRGDINKACARIQLEEGRKLTLNKWILEAIKEKLERDVEAVIGRELIAFYLEQAEKLLEASRWYQSAPVEAQKKITINLESVEFVEVHESGNLTFSCWEEMVVIAKAKCPTSGDSEIFKLGARREIQD